MKTITQLLCLLAFVCFANTTQAQTKEETITWLREKLDNYLEGNSKVSNLKITKIDECLITLEYDFTHIDWDGKIYHLVVEMPTNIKNISKDGRIIYNGELIKEVGLVGRTIYREMISSIEISNREENIRERVEKALKHLATFCPKKQEAF